MPVDQVNLIRICAHLVVKCRWINLAVCRSALQAAKGNDDDNELLHLKAAGQKLNLKKGRLPKSFRPGQFSNPGRGFAEWKNRLILHSSFLGPAQKKRRGTREGFPTEND